MRPIRVPPSHREPIRRLGELSEAQFEALRKALERPAAPEFSRTDLVTSVASAIDESHDEASNLLSALIGASSTKQAREADATEVADAVVRGSTLKLKPDATSVVSTRLAALLDVAGLEILTRAGRLYIDDVQTYCRSRSMSDLRPVFTPTSEPPEVAAAVIKHTLRIRYHTDNGTEVFYLTLDDDGLLDLRRTLDRAIAKGRVLRESAAAAGMQVIDIEEHH